MLATLPSPSIACTSSGSLNIIIIPGSPLSSSSFSSSCCKQTLSSSKWRVGYDGILCVRVSAFMYPSSYLWIESKRYLFVDEEAIGSGREGERERNRAPWLIALLSLLALWSTLHCTTLFTGTKPHTLDGKGTLLSEQCLKNCHLIHYFIEVFPQGLFLCCWLQADSYAALLSDSRLPHSGWHHQHAPLCECFTKVYFTTILVNAQCPSSLMSVESFYGNFLQKFDVRIFSVMTMLT